VGAWLTRLAGVGLPRPPAEEPLPPLDDAMLDLSTDEVLAQLPTTGPDVESRGSGGAVWGSESQDAEERTAIQPSTRRHSPVRFQS
jgi:hypothetical protein